MSTLLSGYVMTTTLSITPKKPYSQFNYQAVQEQNGQNNYNNQNNGNGEVAISSYNYKTMCMATFSAIEDEDYDAEAQGRREYRYYGRQSSYNYRAAAAAGAAVVILGAAAYTAKKRRLCTIDELCAIREDDDDTHGGFGAMDDNDSGKPSADTIEGRGSMKKTLGNLFGRRKDEKKTGADEDSGIFY